MPKYGTVKYGEALYGGEISTIEWTPTGGGNHRGEDWTPDEGQTIAGLHYNIGTFLIPADREIKVEPYNGTLYGALRIEAHNILIEGTLNANGAGFAGGAAGGGGGGGGTGTPGLGGGGGVAKAGGGSNGANGSIGVLTSGGDGGTGRGGSGSFGGAPGGGGVGAGGAGGAVGGYATGGGQGDATTDDSVLKGPGVGGGGGGAGQTLIGTLAGGGGGGGGAGGDGGGSVELVARGLLEVAGSIVAHGEPGGGNGTRGSNANGLSGGRGGTGGSSIEDGLGTLGQGGTGLPSGSGFSGGPGARGAGGGILLRSDGAAGVVLTGAARVRTLGGGSQTGNGGTVKLRTLPNKLTNAGTISAGRTHTATITRGTAG